MGLRVDVAELEDQSMSEFQSHSQAGQDRFVWEVLRHPESGTFLDIGANHPVEKNNTYALEQMGWRGILVENDAHCANLIREQREASILEEDATTVPWLGYLFQDRLDYLSLDVDFASLQVLRDLMALPYRFSVLTVEHDAYRFGTERRDEMVTLLRSKGYDILCADVCDQGMSFEIWAVDPLAVDMAKAEKFRRDVPTDWKEFFV